MSFSAYGALTAAALWLGSSAAAHPPLQTVESVDLQRYAGTWYEIARLPNRFQQQCIGEVTAHYALRADGLLDVLNACRTGPEERDQAAGIARRARDDASGARLEVRFAPTWLSWLPPVWGDYWILYVDEDYQSALVGSPDRRFLWILSRRPQLDPGQFQALLARAAAQQFDTSMLQRTPQAGD